MVIPLVKRFRGYLAPALLTYTVLVTFFLVQTAWDDGQQTSVTRRSQGNGAKLSGHRYVPSKDERRHLRSLEDVGGGLGYGTQEMRSRAISRDTGGKARAPQNGRRVQSSFNSDFYVDDINGNTTDVNNNNISNNSKSLPPRGRDGALEKRVYHIRSEREDKQKMELEVEKGGSMDSSQTQFHTNDKLSQFTNIEIEEMIPRGANNETPSKSETKQAALQFPHKPSIKEIGEKSRDGRSSNSNIKDHNGHTSGFAEAQFCDNIEEDGKLCYRDRVVYSHHKHVNISTNHLSFRGFGGLHIYSAFLDTRQRPASIRVMTIGPKGYHNGPSSLWCAFSTPLSLTRRHRWTGQGDSIATGQTQASQLHFYIASDGHDKGRQFYVMSCTVPSKYLNTLIRFDGNRIDIVAGTQKSALLDTIQERLPMTVINNRGLPWHILKEQALARKKENISSNSMEYQQMKRDQQVDNYLNSKISMSSNWIDKGSSIAQNLNLTRGKDILDLYKSVNSHDVEAKGVFVNPSEGQDSIVSCVAPIYNLAGIVQITEFIELTLLLGSQHIVFYIFHVTADVRHILNRYKDQGLVTVLPWHLADVTEIWAKGRDVALNDCLYRTMFRYDFVLFHDVNEFLIPKITPDLPSLLGFLRTKGKLNTTRISDIVFNSAYFMPPTKPQSANLTTMNGFTKDVPKFISLRSLHRTYFSSQHTIRIIKPVLALRVGAGERKRTTFNINPRFAGAHHYAKCPISPAPSESANGGHKDSERNVSAQTGQQTSTVDCLHTKWDDVIWKYTNKLIQNTKDSIRAFNAQTKGRR